jgi:hypothetical protein
MAGMITVKMQVWWGHGWGHDIPLVKSGLSIIIFNQKRKRGSREPKESEQERNEGTGCHQAQYTIIPVEREWRSAEKLLPGSFEFLGYASTPGAL